MASHQEPQLTPGNRLYLYRLLRDAIGTNRQTFITKLEEALDAENLAAVDIGFENTRELLEELDEFVTLTVFKGGRVYATLTAQPSWDEALDALGDNLYTKSNRSNGKPWKHKKGSKGVKPVKPRMIPQEDSAEQHKTSAGRTQTTSHSRCEQAADQRTSPAERAAETMGAKDDEQAVGTKATGAKATDPIATEAAAHGSAAAGVQEREPKQAAPGAKQDTADEIRERTVFESAASEASTIENATSEHVPPESASLEISPLENTASECTPSESEPAYSLTVVFDPEHADAGITALESTPSEAPGQSSAASPNAPAATHEEEIDLRDYPQDFAEDVYCPASYLRALESLLPLGADALGIAGEWFLIACARGDAELGRNRAAFPLIYMKEGERRAATIRLKRRPAATAGTPWVVDAVETPEPDSPASSGSISDIPTSSA